MPSLFVKAKMALRNEGVGGLASGVCRYTSENYRRLLIPYAVSHISRLRDAPKDQVFDLTYTWLSGLIRPCQSKFELAEIVRILEETRPKVILEIGTAFGGSLFWWCRAAADDATIVTMDLPNGYWNHRDPLYRSFARPGQDLHLVLADSHTQDGLGRVREILQGRQIDFLFIDGDHSYEGVAADFEMYAPLVAANGLIGFHDIVPGPPELVGGVPRFWEEIKTSYGVREIVEDRAQTGCGIGVIEVAR